MRQLGVLVLAAMTMQLGCSWMTVEGPPRHPTPVVECTTSQLAPGVDTAIAVLYGLTSIALLVAGSAAQDEPAEDEVGNEIGGVLFMTGLVGAAIAVPFGLSAHSGYQKIADCRAAKARAAQYYPPAYMGPAPQPYYPAPQPYYPPR